MLHRDAMHHRGSRRSGSVYRRGPPSSHAGVPSARITSPAADSPASSAPSATAASTNGHSVRSGSRASIELDHTRWFNVESLERESWSHDMDRPELTAAHRALLRSSRRSRRRMGLRSEASRVSSPTSEAGALMSAALTTYRGSLPIRRELADPAPRRRSAPSPASPESPSDCHRHRAAAIGSKRRRWRRRCGVLVVTDLSRDQHCANLRRTCRDAHRSRRTRSPRVTTVSAVPATRY